MERGDCACNIIYIKASAGLLFSRERSMARVRRFFTSLCWTTIYIYKLSSRPIITHTYIATPVFLILISRDLILVFGDSSEANRETRPDTQTDHGENVQKCARRFPRAKVIRNEKKNASGSQTKFLLSMTTTKTGNKKEPIKTGSKIIFSKGLIPFF